MWIFARLLLSDNLKVVIQNLHYLCKCLCKMVLFLVTGCTIACCTVLVQNVPLSPIREDQPHVDHFIFDFQWFKRLVWPVIINKLCGIVLIASEWRNHWYYKQGYESAINIKVSYIFPHFMPHAIMGNGCTLCATQMSWYRTTRWWQLAPKWIKYLLNLKYSWVVWKV